MTTNLQRQLSELWQQVLAYLPNLLGGLLLVVLGLLIGWIVKRMIIQLLVILRFDRLFIRLRWKTSLSKADLRHALYNLVGNIAFVIVFLLFLNSVLAVLKLTVLSKLIEQGVLFVPRLAVALIVLGAGWYVAARTGSAVRHSLLMENVPRATLIARAVKFVLVLFFSAMALAELNIAREIVLIGFAAAALCVCLSGVLLIAGGGDAVREFFKKGGSGERERTEKTERVPESPGKGAAEIPAAKTEKSPAENAPEKGPEEPSKNQTDQA